MRTPKDKPSKPTEKPEQYRIVVYRECNERIFGVWRKRTEAVFHIPVMAADARCAIEFAAEALSGKEEHQHEPD